MISHGEISKQTLTGLFYIGNNSIREGKALSLYSHLKALMSSCPHIISSYHQKGGSVSTHELQADTNTHITADEVRLKRSQGAPPTQYKKRHQRTPTQVHTHILPVPACSMLCEGTARRLLSPSQEARSYQKLTKHTDLKLLVSRNVKK